MATPQDVLEMLAALQEDGHDLRKDPDAALEAAYELGYEHESVWFYEWPKGFDPASDLEAKPNLNMDKYNTALVELQSFQRQS